MAVFWRQFKPLESKEVPKRSRAGKEWGDVTRRLSKDQVKAVGIFVLSCRKQLAILADLVRDLPLEFDFLFSQSQAEVISGKQEGTAGSPPSQSPHSLSNGCLGLLYGADFYFSDDNFLGSAV